jgi:hypothetical protein
MNYYLHFPVDKCNVTKQTPTLLYVIAGTHRAQRIHVLYLLYSASYGNQITLFADGNTLQRFYSGTGFFPFN